MTYTIKHARNLEETASEFLLFAPVRVGHRDSLPRGLKAARNSGETWNVVTWKQREKFINSLTCFRQLSWKAFIVSRPYENLFSAYYSRTRLINKENILPVRAIVQKKTIFSFFFCHYALRKILLQRVTNISISTKILELIDFKPII